MSRGFTNTKNLQTRRIMMSIKPHSNSTLFLFETTPDNPGKRRFLNLLVGYYELITHNTLPYLASRMPKNRIARHGS